MQKDFSKRFKEGERIELFANYFGTSPDGLKKEKGHIKAEGVVLDVRGDSYYCYQVDILRVDLMSGHWEEAVKGRHLLFFAEDQVRPIKNGLQKALEYAQRTKNKA